jgi:hypothetical protein
MKADEKKCPRCAEINKLDARVCKHCGYEYSAEELEAVDKKKKQDAKNGTIGCAVLAIGLVLAIGMCSGGSSETPEEAKQREAKTAEDRRTGMHCLSGWDGSNASFTDQVKARLREPDSFEHVETRITPVDKSGNHTVMMQYRAKNGFGGTNNPTAIGTVRQSDCAATVTAISLDGQ